MKPYSICATTGLRSLLLAALINLPALATESSADNRLCDAHAAAMVAEMKAAAEAPMSDVEVALVRRTAHKSCLLQAQVPATVPAVPAAPVAGAAATDTTAAAASGKQGTWDSLLRLLDQDTVKSDGHKRLRRRSGTY